MKQLCKRITLGVLGMMVILLFPLVVYGEELPSGLLIGDSDGIYLDKSGEYYVNIEEMQPGKEYMKEITIRNLDKTAFDLGLLVTPTEKTGKVDLDEAIAVTITKGTTEIYTGTLVGNQKFDWSLTPLEIGKIKYGEDTILKVTFKLSPGLSSEDLKEENETKIKWNFVGTKKEKPIESSDSSDSSDSTNSSDSTTPSSTNTSDSTAPSGSTTPSTSDVDTGGKKKPIIDKYLPQTGEEWVNFLYRVCAGLFLVTIALLLFKKKRNEEKE